MIPSLGLGGAERLLVDIVTNTARERFEHAVIRMQPPDDHAAALEQSATSLTKLDWKGRSDWPYAARRVAGEAKRFSPDIIQSSMFEANVAARLSRTLGVRGAFLTNVVSLEYDPQVVRVAGWSRRKVEARRLLDASTAALTRSRFVACSKCVATATQMSLRARGEDVRTIYNSVDPATLQHTVEESRELRRAHRIPDDGFVYLNVSRLIASKAQAVLIRAFRRVVDVQPNAYLALVGGGPEADALVALCGSLGLQQRVRFLGQPGTIGPSYGIAQAFVFPSLIEGMSLALIEAMMSGLPCIASDIPANVEVVAHEKTGLVFPASDEAALASAMDRLYRDERMRAQWASAGRSFALESFASARIIPQWEKLYADLAGKGTPARQV